MTSAAPTTSTPLNRQYARNLRNDLVRWLIFDALKDGDRFEQECLFMVLNVWFEEDGELPALRLSWTGFRAMIARNCESIWIEDERGVLSRNPQCHLLWNGVLGEQKREYRGSEVSTKLILNKLVTAGELFRDKGGKHYQNRAL